MNKNEVISRLLVRLATATSLGLRVIPWSTPAPWFGELATATVATLGLNPSNREFVDERGAELEGSSRRLHTLRSLALSNWDSVCAQHLEDISNACERYFMRNPYRVWFDSLESILLTSNASYFSGTLFNAPIRVCHLDIVPYATECKWTELTPAQRAFLTELSAEFLGHVINASQIRALIMNGRTVSETLQRIGKARLTATEMPAWTLSRKSVAGSVKGIAYHGHVSQVSGVKLKRRLPVFGFNHNIQSSFGVSLAVRSAIADWINERVQDILE